jgi:hypothetical protein
MATIKQKKLARILASDNTLTAKEASIKAGYSINTNLHPVMKSQTFQELLDKYLPDKLLLKTTKDGLKATKTEVIGGKVIESKDHAIRLKAVEISAKLKGKYIESATQVNLEGIKVQVMPRQWDTISSTDME